MIESRSFQTPKRKKEQRPPYRSGAKEGNGSGESKRGAGLGRGWKGTTNGASNNDANQKEQKSKAAPRGEMR
jgi:hypothetical protein